MAQMHEHAPQDFPEAVPLEPIVEDTRHGHAIGPS
jgi:hypothetical protein